MSRKGLFSRGFLAIAAIAALAGCASGGGARGTGARDDSAVLDARAVERWNLLIAKDFAKAYEYLSPGIRSTKSKEKYAQELSGTPVKWEKVQFLNKECASADSCKVLVQIDYEVTIPSAGVGKVKVPAPVEEQWVRLKGKWYFVPQEVVKGGLH